MSVMTEKSYITLTSRTSTSAARPTPRTWLCPADGWNSCRSEGNPTLRTGSFSRNPSKVSGILESSRREKKILPVLLYRMEQHVLDTICRKTLELPQISNQLSVKKMNNIRTLTTSDLYYKPITIVNDNFSII